MQTSRLRKLRNLPVGKLARMESGRAKWLTYPFCRIPRSQCRRWRDRDHEAGRLLALQTAVGLSCAGWGFFFLEWFHITWEHPKKQTNIVEATLLQWNHCSWNTVLNEAGGTFSSQYTANAGRRCIFLEATYRILVSVCCCLLSHWCNSSF